jgi:DNA polymerase I
MPIHVIIDTSYLMYRSYFAYPRLIDKNGVPSGAFFGFAKAIFAIIKEYNPATISFALDLQAPTWRDKIFSEYKAGRSPMEEAMKVQLPVILDWIHKVGVGQVYSKEGFEADDLIKSISDDLLKNEENETYVFSSDRDLYQMFTTPRVSFIRSKMGEYSLYNQFSFDKEFGVLPTQWVDYKALVGDSGDNLKGVEGIGPKTAAKILNQVGDIATLFEVMGWESTLFRKQHSFETVTEFIADKKNEKLLEKIFSCKVQLEQTYNLATLQMVEELSLPTRLPEFDQGLSMFVDYGFKSLVTTMGKTMGVEAKHTPENDENALF